MLVNSVNSISVVSPVKPVAISNSFQSEAASAGVALDKTQVTISEEGAIASNVTIQNANSFSENPGAAHLGDDPIFNALGPGVTLKQKSLDQQTADYVKENNEFRISPMNKTNSSLSSVQNELKGLQSKIEKSHPNLLGKKWDMALKDGKIEVINDNINSKDKQWLENTLNRNSKIVDAVKGFYSSVVKFFEQTQEHTSGAVRQKDGHVIGYVYNVAEQINGKLPVREMMAKALALNSPGGYSSMPFTESLHMSGQYLSTVREAKYGYNNLDLTDATTAQYVQSHPNG